MSVILLACDGGHLVLPHRASLLLSREHGGNLVVNPPRPVWERSELSSAELTQFGFLVAAGGRAMIDTLPQLSGGCVNYWEAGNWALNDAAEPTGRKDARSHRSDAPAPARPEPRVDRSGMGVGESPRFPAFADRDTWGATYQRLTAAECAQIDQPRRGVAA